MFSKESLMQTRRPILHETLLSYDFKTRDMLAVNEEVYISLLNYLSKEDISKIAQPNLIVGEAGCGKTFLIKRLYDSIKEGRGHTLYPIVIEGKSLFSTDDIWSQCASSLNVESERSGYDDILEWQKHHSKRILLFIDNIQYYFERTDNTDQYGLRGKLNRAGAPILVATSEKVLPAFTKYDAAFFDGFKITYIKPLSITSISSVTDGQYDRTRLERILSYLPKTIRSVLIAVEILEKSEDADTDLDFLSDYFFSHYQGMFDAASIQTQRILAALAQAETGHTLPEIRAITGQENGKISPYLKLMIDQRLIGKEAKTLRGGIYFIVDPLFKLWLRHITFPNHPIRQENITQAR